MKDKLKKLSLRYATVLQKLKCEIAEGKSVRLSLKRCEMYYHNLTEESTRANESLKFLSQRILSTQEEERRQISHELHEKIAQSLSGINVHLSALKKDAEVNPRTLRGSIARTQRLVTGSIKTVHRFARDLRPTLLDDFGLLFALNSYIKDFAKRTYIPVHTQFFRGVEKLDSNKRTVLYRIVQSALTNVAQHAQASLVQVIIKKMENSVRMEIHDNGKSFSVRRELFSRKARRVGLLSMRERLEMVGGSFDVESNPEHGTTIRAEIPFK